MNFLLKAKIRVCDFFDIAHNELDGSIVCITLNSKIFAPRTNIAIYITAVSLVLKLLTLFERSKIFHNVDCPVSRLFLVHSPCSAVLSDLVLRGIDCCQTSHMSAIFLRSTTYVVWVMRNYVSVMYSTLRTFASSVSEWKRVVALSLASWTFLKCVLYSSYRFA